MRIWREVLLPRWLPARWFPSSARHRETRRLKLTSRPFSPFEPTQPEVVPWVDSAPPRRLGYPHSRVRLHTMTAYVLAHVLVTSSVEGPHIQHSPASPPGAQSIRVPRNSASFLSRKEPIPRLRVRLTRTSRAPGHYSPRSRLPSGAQSPHSAHLRATPREEAALAPALLRDWWEPYNRMELSSHRVRILDLPRGRAARLPALLRSWWVPSYDSPIC